MTTPPPRSRIGKSLMQLQERIAAEGAAFDAVIVGSGYGGSVAASQLAGMQIMEGGQVRALRVCLLERGREFLPGEFPGTFGELPREVRIGRQSDGRVTGDEGLFDVRLGDDVNVLVANGLGGGSLINAGVMLKPEAEDFRPSDEEPKGEQADRAAWSNLLRRLDHDGRFEAARRALGVRIQQPDGRWVDNSIRRLMELPAKTEALQALGAEHGATVMLPPISVALEDDESAPTAMKACNQCGDCMTGCNVGAKKSLDTNLLRSAHAGKVEIYTGATVLDLSRRRMKDAADASWVVRVVHTDPILQARQGAPVKLTAKRVILAAGALGSPEILLRSRKDTVAFSPALGAGISCNGDNIAAIRGLSTMTRGCADEDQALDERKIGPTITAGIQFPVLSDKETIARKAPAARPFLLQEFSVPGPLKRLFEEIVTTADTLARIPDGDDSMHATSDLDPLAVDPDAMDRTLLVGMIGHDDARGSLQLAVPEGSISDMPKMGAVRIDWPDARRGRELSLAHEHVRRVVEDEAPGSPDEHGTNRAPRHRKLVANPMWRLLPPGLDNLVSQPLGPVLTVHPLGGCRIGPLNPTEDGERGGVVDEHGVVHDAGHRSGNDQWQGSLYVLDGSIVPLSLGVNPALTITALALHGMAHLRSTWDDLVKPAARLEAPVFQSTDRTSPDAVLTSPCTLQPVPSVRRTEVEIVERLCGPATVSGQKLVVELTLHFRPTSVADLVAKSRPAVEVDGSQSRLRLYKEEDWKLRHLRSLGDELRADFVLLEAPLEGSLKFLQREASSETGRAWRGFRSWLCNRGTRDIMGLWTNRERKDGGTGEGAIKRLQRARGQLAQLKRLASRAGEVRLFEYTLSIGRTLSAGSGLELLPGAVILGDKRLTYDRRANPWRQLTQMRLTSFPGLVAGATPVLDLDARFLANRRVPLLQIAHQRSQAEALSELMSLVLYLARVLISTHLWTFRRPDTPIAREPERLPGTVAGLPDPQITELAVDRWPRDSATPGEPVKIRLTRYPRVGAQPMLMIHGYSVSGNTFTHPSLDPSAAAYFWNKTNHDVWVVELRTSSGLASATFPWSMEQTALVDIPAALLFVHAITSRRVDVFAHCIGCAMLSMALLTDPRQVRSGRTELGVNDWLTREHLGNLAALNGPEPKGDRHPVVRSVVLSQKGPVLRYTDSNIFRAYAMQFLRRWLLGNDYQFRPSRDPKVAEQLLDRLLASLPYPAPDYDVENPKWPWARTPWTGTRHRMDALYGRDFNAENMDPGTLEAIDDLFGPINLDTVSQTIHFARFNSITNQRGRGEFVTREKLTTRWKGIPTLAIHGRDNGLADVHTQVMLKRAMEDAGVPFESHEFESMGHQDVLIGKRRIEVFERVATFLRALPQPKAVGPDEPTWIVETPWIGPRIEPPRAGLPLRVAGMSRPDQGASYLCTVPVIKTLGVPPTASVVRDHISISELAPSGEWIYVKPSLSAFETPMLKEAEAGWLAVMVYPLAETVIVDYLPHRQALDAAAPGANVQPRLLDAGSTANGSAALPHQEKVAENFPETPVPEGVPKRKPDPKAGVIRAVEFAGHADPVDASLLRIMKAFHDKSQIEARIVDWTNIRPWSELELCYLRHEDLQRADSLPTGSAGHPLRFMLGSCQYPSSLIDERTAGASLNMLAESSDGVAFSLLVGDQVYADATAGLVDPVRHDELYFLPHERALRLPAMRAVMRRMPVHMLLDDHELFDNWELPPGQRRTRAVDASRSRTATARKYGLAAYRRYDRMGAPDPAKKFMPWDFQFDWCGHGFYMLDARTCRRRGRPGDKPDQWSVFADDRHRDALAKWLTDRRDEVKFVATPSLLFPRQRKSADSLRNACLSDAWDGFPGALSWLLAFLVDNDVRNTVFLSGDEHHSMVSEVWLSREGKRCKIVSVHSSAMYAPFPFANGRRLDLMKDEHIESSIYGVECTVKTTFADPGDGYAVIGLRTDSGKPELQVIFRKAHLQSQAQAPMLFELA